MRLSFCGTPLEDGYTFKDADTGQSDKENRQATQPVRLLGGPHPLETAFRNALIDRFFDAERGVDRKVEMLREVGAPEEEIAALTRNPWAQESSSRAWKIYEAKVDANRRQEWMDEDTRKPHLGLWGYRNRMIKVEDWEPASREEVVIRVKHFVISNEDEVNRLKSEIERFERFEREPAVPREPIPEDVQTFVWRRDRGRCVKCGSQDRLEFDHIIPLALGGSNTARNLQLLCEYHNRSKGSGDSLFPPTSSDGS